MKGNDIECHEKKTGILAVVFNRFSLEIVFQLKIHVSVVYNPNWSRTIDGWANVLILTHDIFAISRQMQLPVREKCWSIWDYDGNYAHDCICIVHAYDYDTFCSKSEIFWNDQICETG